MPTAAEVSTRPKAYCKSFALLVPSCGESRRGPAAPTRRTPVPTPPTHTSKLRRRPFIRSGAIGALAVNLGLGTASADSGVSDELRIANEETPYGLDPVHEYSAGYLRSIGVAEGLLRLTAQGDVDVDLAAWFSSDGPNTWRVGLRPNVRFHGGTPVTAKAVAASLERSRNLAPFPANLLKGISIESESDLVLRFTAGRPIPALPQILADEWLMIHNADSFGPKDNSFDVKAADYTGPFKIAAFNPRVQVVAERNDNYWGLKPRLARIVLNEVSDPDARSLAALSGEAHIVRIVTAEAASRIQRDRRSRIYTIPSTDCAAAYLNTAKEPFSDVRVRQALAWALDRDEIVAVAFNGLARTAPSWLGTNVAYPEARRTGYTRVDLPRAERLLDEAGWTLAPRATVRTRQGKPLRFRVVWWGSGKPTAELVQAQWAKVGVSVEVLGSPDYGLLDSMRSAGDWDVFIEGWGTDGDPESTLSRHVAANGDLNYMKFTDAVMADLLKGFESLTDLEDRRLQALHINQRQADTVSFIPISSRARLNAVSIKVHGYVPHFQWWQYEVHPEMWVSR